jgi:integrase
MSQRGSIHDRWWKTNDGERTKTDRYRAGHRYRAVYRGPDGRQHSQSFDTKEEAGRWLRAELGRIDTGAWTDPGAGDRPYAEWAAEWLAGLDVKPKTRASYQSLLDSRVLPAFGDVRLSKVSTAMVRRWLADLREEGLSGSRVTQARQVLRASLETARLDGLIGSNPVVGTKAPRALRREHRYLTEAEVARLADAAEARSEGSGVVVWFLALTGLRWGEMVALRGRRVDVLRRKVTVAESVTEVNGKLIEGTPKTHERREVVYPRYLAEMVAPLVTGPDELVFPAPRGGYLRSPNWRRRVWQPAVADAGLSDLVPHDLRHTAASLAVASGASILAVARMLGHVDPSVTLKVYAGLYTDDLEALADRLDERLSGSGVAPVLPGTSAGLIPIEAKGA